MPLYNAVSGDYQVVSNGIPITSDRLSLSNDFNPNPRTGIGFTTNNHLVLVTVDGGGNPWYGMTVAELGWFMATNLEVFNAINADGGGSTTLAVATPIPHLVNHPSSGSSGRAVGSSLAVFAVPAYIAVAGITNGTIFSSPSEIDIPVQVLDTAGAVTNVIFYAGTSILGTVGTAPFTLKWVSPKLGNYWLSLVAVDNSGLSTTSAIVNITVAQQASNPPNSVTDAPLLPVWASMSLIFMLIFAGWICLSLRTEKPNT
jgi:hypothetical protein